MNLHHLIDKHLTSLDAADGHSQLSNVLDFNMQQQGQTNWCWAAICSSVSQFYDTASPWTQCKLVSAEFNQTCCTDAYIASTPCNQPWYPDKGLIRTGNFVSIQDPQAADIIRAEIDAGRVIPAAIYWNHGGGHAVAIYGYSVSEVKGKKELVVTLYIDDPFRGKSIYNFDAFMKAYRGDGFCNNLYFTKKASAPAT